MFVIAKRHLLILAAMSTMVACNSTSKDDVKKSQNSAAIEKDMGDIDINKISEALGHFIGRNINTPGINFNLDSIIKGMREGAAGKPAPMSDEEYKTTMSVLQEKAFNAMSEKNLDAASTFMKDNAKTVDVIEVVPGQLQYKILHEGQGPVVDEHGTPLINYSGKYIDDTIFGSSESTGPVTIPLDQTIPGFSKGIVGMKEGEKRRIFIHPEFGYGLSGQLQPNALLIFDIEVVKAVSPDKDSAENGLGDKDLFDELESDQEFNEHKTPDQAPKK